MKKVSPGDDDFKAVVFERALKQNQFRVGDLAKVRRTSRKGMIKQIITDPNNIQWSSNKPHYIQLELDGQVLLVHHSQIKRTSK